MFSHLKLNGDKTELLVLTARQRPKPPIDSIKIGADVIKASKSAKNIGVWLDCVLSMHVQINNICKNAFSTFVTYLKLQSFLRTVSVKYLFMPLFRRSWIIVTSFYLAHNSHKLIDYNMYKIQPPACLQPPADMITLLLYEEAYNGYLCPPVLTLRYFFLFLKY